MLTQIAQSWARGVARKVASIFVRTPITPNMLTVFGFVLNCIVAYVIATGHLVAGGVMMIFASLFDMLDGALAKISGRASDFGAFLDSVVDRYSESVILFGLMIYYYGQPQSQGLIPIILIYAVLVGSMMISYARARAGALNIANEVGLLARPERIILLTVGLLFRTVLLEPVLWILAVGTHVTAMQRIVHVWRIARSRKTGNQS